MSLRSIFSISPAYCLVAQYDATLGRLANAEAQIDELKEQLDENLGAEEMLEQLTERNLMLGEVGL